MHKRVRALIDYAASLGFTHEGLDGHGHHRVRHTSGETYRIASTPGDWRGDLNTKAGLRRIAGTTSTGPSHRRSRKAARGSGYSPRQTPAERYGAERADALLARWQELYGRFCRLAAERPTDVTSRALIDVSYELCDVEAALRALHKPMPIVARAADWRRLADWD